jgi:hypothetical protein
MIDRTSPQSTRTARARVAHTVLATALAVAFAATARPARAQDSATPAPPTPPAEGTPPAEAAPAAPAPALAPAPAPALPHAPPPEGTAVPAPSAPAPGANPLTESWFDRAPLTLTIGAEGRRWSVTFYGFVEADYIADTTRSYNDAIGSALVARTDVYQGTVGRTQFSMRNTRIGLAFQAPQLGSLRPSALIEGDFFGSQTAPPTGSENTFYDSPTFRIRHAYLKLDGGVVDFLAGQTYDVFGWQNYFFPASLEFLGLPNMVFSRNTQLRLSRTVGADGPVSVDIALEAGRPAQRDSQVPDLEAGLRLCINGWKGITTPGNVRTIAAPLSVGVSAISRRFKVDSFLPPPTQSSNSVAGWGVSVDGLVPVIPAQNANDRGNRLTLTGSFVTGAGIADLLTTGGGAQFPTLPNPAQASPPPQYTPDIDNGLVSFDTQGRLHAIKWQAFKVGLQYYLPPLGGRLIFAANYTEAKSSNMAQLFPMGGAEIELLGAVADHSKYADANLFFDATPEIRFGLSGQWTQVHYLDGNLPHNIRAMGQAVYVF